MKRSLVRHWGLFFPVGLILAMLLTGSKADRKASDESQLSGVPQQKVSPTTQQNAGYVLRANEGEVLQRGKGNTVTIKVDPKTGSPSMAMGTQLLGAGVGIPLHIHEYEDEVLFVNDGGGSAVLGEQRKAIGKGDTIYIPHGVWHGVQTNDTGASLLWVVTPPGLESFFREISTPLGAPPKTLTPAQIEDIGRKHGVKFKQR